MAGCPLKCEQATRISYVIVGPLSTVGYSSVVVLSTVDSGLTNLIHDRYSRLSKRERNTHGWMCPLKREQARRVSYDTLTHSRLL